MRKRINRRTYVTKADHDLWETLDHLADDCRSTVFEEAYSGASIGYGWRHGKDSPWVTTPMVLVTCTLVAAILLAILITHPIAYLLDRLRAPVPSPR